MVGVIIGFVTNAGMSDAIGSFPSTANEAATAMRDFLDGMNEVQCTGAVIYSQNIAVYLHICVLIV